VFVIVIALFFYKLVLVIILTFY